MISIHSLFVDRLVTSLPTVFVVAVLCVACTSADEEHGTKDTADSNVDSGSAPPSVIDGGSGNLGNGATKKLGSFNIDLKASNDMKVASTTVISGKICDAPPINDRIVIWDVTSEEAGCQLLEPRVPFCEEACEEKGLFCVEGNQCTAAETCFDVGTVTVQGLHTSGGEKTITLMPVVNNYQYPGSDLLYPPFGEGDPIRLEASGEELQPFVIDSTGISPLELITSDDILVAPDQPITLEWVPAAQQDISRIQIRLDISHHGGQKGEIFCDVVDSGSLEVPASLVTKLINLGVAGFPTIDIIRVSTGSTSTDTCNIQLKISSVETRSVQIPGLISCFDSNECPSDQTCQDFMCI